MAEFVAAIPVVFAQDGGNGSFYSTALLFLPIAVMIYFLIIMPQQQQEKKRRTMVEALKKNDLVLTTGGLYGTVISVDPKSDRVVLRVDDERGVKLGFTLASVARVIKASGEKPTESA